MRVLLTGIDGFVGSHTAEFLIGLPGVDVHGTVLPSAGDKNIRAIASRLHLHPADLLTPRMAQSIILDVRPDRILHFAAQAFVPASVEDPVGTFRTNILGGIEVLDAARLMKLRTGMSPSVLLVSTGEVYGDAGPEAITEESPLSPRNPYAASKAAIDLIGQEYRRGLGVDVTVARPFNHAGPRQNPLFVCSNFGRQFASLALGKTPPTIRVGNIDVGRDFLDVRDVVRAYWSLFERHSDAYVFNVCSGRVTMIREVISLYQQISGVRAEVVTEKDRVRSYDVPMITGSCSRLRQATGWTPSIPLRQTLQDVFAYWLSELSAQA